jgi:phage/plasmid-like protein (TIGR03299 family)
MTMEVSEYIKANWLSGNEKANGMPWWHSPETFNPEHHWEGFIPVYAVEKLFGFDVNLSKVWVERKDGTLFEATAFVACVPDNKDAVFGIHSEKYSVKGHQYRQWAVDGAFKVCNGCVGITNAGLLVDGAQAWVNVSTPEAWKTKQGVDFQPNLLFTTSFDGSIASTVKETQTLSVCDNTRQQALNSKGLTYKVKHTKGSALKLEDAHAALRLLEESAEAFSAELATLCEWEVSNQQFDRFMALLNPMPEISQREAKADFSTRNATIVKQRREKLNELYRSDGRVAPWTNTAFGIVQMVNTFNHHVQTVRGEGKTIHRAERNMSNVITGKFHQDDVDALALLAKVCERELVAA